MLQCDAVRCSVQHVRGFTTSSTRGEGRRGWHFREETRNLGRQLCCSQLIVATSYVQCVAVCCSVLQCVAVCCSMLHRIVRYCRVLQCVAVCCSALQFVAVRCSALQCVAVRCSALQCIAVRCSALQCVVASIRNRGYGVATISRLLKMIGVFCKRTL